MANGGMGTIAAGNHNSHGPFDAGLLVLLPAVPCLQVLANNAALVPAHAGAP